MGKTYTRNKGYKKDRRDNSFQKSKKFKHWKERPDHKTSPTGEFFPPDDGDQSL